MAGNDGSATAEYPGVAAVTSWAADPEPATTVMAAVVNNNNGWFDMRKLNETLLNRGIYHIVATDCVHYGMEKVQFDIYERCVSDSCVCVHKINGAVTLLKPCRTIVECFLRGDTDPDWEYLVYGCIFGHNVVNIDCTAEYSSTNYVPRNQEAWGIMEEKLQKEIASEALSIVNKPELCTHAIGLIPKPDGSGFRAIVDCSEPAGRSINDFTESVATKFSYNSVDDVAEAIQVNDFVSTIDIQDAYRAVSIHPDSSRRMGLSWVFTPGVVTHLRDNRLCMGLSSSPFVFSKVSDLVVRCMVREGHTQVVNYLDDFAIITRTFEEGCKAQQALVGILRRLGFSVSYKKLTSPMRISRFLGIELDTVDMKLRLPPDKLCKLEKKT